MDLIPKCLICNGVKVYLECIKRHEVMYQVIKTERAIKFQNSLSKYIFTLQNTQSLVTIKTALALDTSKILEKHESRF